MPTIIDRHEYRRRLRAFLAKHEPVTGQLSCWYYVHRHKFHEELKNSGTTVVDTLSGEHKKSRS
ncbi:MAG TPA: hypothetical protein PLX33_02410 [Alphaproteobacteria bacterium]|nr:hypothetical protein [Alphaproteobacteria bacterium]